jgi:DNA invertase Pin-like site-specific DNA recombinase
METEETIERGTIDTQVELMKNFVSDTEDIAIAEVYKDADYSGTNFDRPAFTRMMEDIKHGKINCVIVKDLSRLGRNYVETSNYIERVFPFFHVRFLAVTDDFDSFREGVDLTVPLKNIINEFYSKDLAKKSRSAKQALWKEGKFTGAWEPYGYRKSEEDRHQLVIDEEAAVHVREIFSMYLDGASYSDIAKKLNAEGVLSPTLQRKYYKTGEKQMPEAKPWNNYEVKRVLQDAHCTGDSVYGKYQQSVFQGNKQRTCPESEWIYAEGTHEGIIDRELFQQVQEKIRKFTEAYKAKHQLNNGNTKSQNFYTGKIWCSECGNRMVLTKEKSGTFYYICGANANHKAGGNQCKGHRVKKEYVDEEVLRLIQSHMKVALDMEKLIQEMNSASRNQTQYLLLDKEVGKLRRELSRISKRKSDLYEDYSERLITEEEYMQFSRIYSNEIENIKSRLDITLATQVRYSQEYHIEEGWGNVIHTYMSKRKLTKEMAEAFVDSIVIHSKYDYEIKLVYDDQFIELEKLKKEKEAQSK